MNNNASFHISQLASEKARLQDNITWSPSSINYDNHPAYQKVVDKVTFGTRVKALALFIKSFIVVLIKRIINYELIDSRYRSPKNLGDALGFVSSALKNSLNNLLSRRNHTLSVDSAEQSIVARLNEDGIVVQSMPNGYFERLEELSQSAFNELEQRRKSLPEKRKFHDSRHHVNRLDNEALYEHIEKILKESGTYEAIKKQLGREIKLSDVNPQINDVTDDFWTKTFDDLDLEHPETAYFHRDASGGDIKVIFYMSDVGEQQGPFNYVLGSNNIKLSRLDDYICEANDSNGFAGTSFQARLNLMSLPRFLRQKGTFGNDVTEKDQLKQAILESNCCITGAKASFVTFNTKGIHRGGCVTSGVRKVITCVIG